jgi:hypothetical protein
MSEFRGRRGIVADLLTGVFVTALGAATVLLSARMPTFEQQGANPLTAPGIFPALVGFCFIISGLILVTRSGKRLWVISEDEPPGPSPVSLRVAGAFLLMLLAVALVGRIDIRIVLAGFALIFCVAFVNWDRRKLPRQLVGVVAATAIAAIAIPLVFEDLFLVRMP